MSNTLVPGRPDWTAGPLYRLMLDIFPEHRTKMGVLDIQKLCEGLGKSHEAIYKWLRQGKITTDNARGVIKLAAAADNAAALRVRGLAPPKLEDFLPFM